MAVFDRREPLTLNWLDRFALQVAPRWGARRIRYRAAARLLQRHFEGSGRGRRTAGWIRDAGDANAANSTALEDLRNVARDLVRNNAYAKAVVATIADHTCGWGVTAKPARGAAENIRARALELWKPWAETPACDANGRSDLYGLQKLAMKTVAVSGECLVRRRWRRPEDGLPLPLQLQVLEPDYLDTRKDGVSLETGGRIVQGIEFDPIGRRVAYWLYKEHPGALWGRTLSSARIPAEEILHVYVAERPGQARGYSWFAPVILRLKDFDDYEDAALVKQKIAACLAVLTTDPDGSAPALGAKADSESPPEDSLEPGMILNVPPGRQISVVNPPLVSEHAEYSQTVLQAIATGLGVTYEDITGNYQNMPFSAARMSRLRHWARVEDWRWQLLIPQFCTPVWGWAMQAAQIMGLPEAPGVEWSAPPAPMIEPDKEGLAYQRNVRSGIMSLSEAIRERGYDPEDLLAELAADFAKLDALGLILDSDPRKTTQAGNPREQAKKDTPNEERALMAAQAAYCERQPEATRELASAVMAVAERPAPSPPTVVVNNQAPPTALRKIPVRDARGNILHVDQIPLDAAGGAEPPRQEAHDGL